MKISETVTFGGSGLNRMAELRGNDAEMADILANDGSYCVVFWRGKPLMAGAAKERLVRLPMNHPILRDLPNAPIFLGQESSRYCFAQDISCWRPENVDADAQAKFLDQSVQCHPELPKDHGFVELRLVMAGLSARDGELVASAKALFHWHRSHRFCAKCGKESQMSMAGWQRNCGSCAAPHFPRTDPVVIMLITRGNSVLMGRSPGWPDGMYSLLAGFIEPGETIEGAVRREVFEEAAIEVGEVTYLASQPWSFPNSMMIGCHGVALNDKIEIDPHEIESAMWVTREQMMAIFAGENPEILPARKGAIAHFILHNWLADRLE